MNKAFTSIKRGLKQAIRHSKGVRDIHASASGKTRGVIERLTFTRGSGNIFVDLGFDKIVAKNLQLRSDLIFHIVEIYRKSGVTRAAAAKKFGLTKTRLNALLRGRLRLFDLDALVKIASRAGLNVRLVIKKAA